MLLDDDLRLYIVADGIGGKNRGEIASEIATRAAARFVEAKKEVVKAVELREEPHSSLVRLAEDAVAEACREVYQLSSTDPDYARMGTTMTLLLFAGDKAVMAHVGNTRLYLLRGKTVHLLSTDHTMATDLVRSGAASLTEALDHPYAHVLTRAIGREEMVQVDALLLDVLPHDRFLLCSNGLGPATDQPDKMLPYLSADPASIPRDLAHLAREQGGDDDLTAVLVFTEDREQQASRVPRTLKTQTMLDALGALPLFENLDLPQLQRLLNISERRTYPAGPERHLAGVLNSQFYNVQRGKISLVRGGSSLVELAPGDYLGEGLLVLSRPCRASLRTLEQCELLVISRERFQGLIRQQPSLGVVLLRGLCRRLSTALDRAQGLLATVVQAPDSPAPSAEDLF
jgi:protein phosphatase